MKVLIAYASAQGSTQSIAERMHSRLSSAEAGFAADSGVSVALSSVTGAGGAPIPSLDGVDVLVLGSCIHHEAWLKEGADFVTGTLEPFLRKEEKARKELAKAEGEKGKGKVPESAEEAGGDGPGKETAPTAPMKVWAFSVGMPPQKMGLLAAERWMMERWVKKHVPEENWMGHDLFMGRYQKEGMPPMMQGVLSTLRIGMEDKRDWDAIDKWTDGVAAEIKKIFEGGVERAE